jgi:hypothetical protein
MVFTRRAATRSAASLRRRSCLYEEGGVCCGACGQRETGFSRQAEPDANTRTVALV